MGTVTGLTAARMLAIEAASIIGGAVVGNDLILTKHDGSTIDAGNVRGPVGPAGPAGPGMNDLARDSFGVAIQEGIISGGTVTRIDATTVRIAAGSAWIQGDNITGFGNGLYPVSWPQTDITGIPAEAGTAQRLDQFILTLTGAPFDGTCSVSRLAGASQGAGGITVTNRNGAAALPAGSMRLCDLIIDVNGVTTFVSTGGNPNVRDRRPWAKGANYSYQANGLADYTTSSGSFVNIDDTVLAPRLEISSGMIDIELDGTIWCPGNFYFTIDQPAAVNGGSTTWWGNSVNGGVPAGADDFNARKVLRQRVVCAPGSIQTRPRWAANGGNPNLKRAANYPLTFGVREIISQNAYNGMG